MGVSENIKMKENVPNNKESRNVEQDTKINLKSRPGFESILPKLNLYTKEAIPHVNNASSVNIYPINSGINLTLLNIALKLY